MAADPEAKFHPEHIPPAERPSLVIDEDLNEQDKRQLQLDEQWLLSRPATRGVALNVYIASNQSDSSVWWRLIDSELGGRFGFDEQTERLIAGDSHIKVIQERRGQKYLSETTAQELGRNLRIERLKIFLERAKNIKKLGTTSLASEL